MLLYSVFHKLTATIAVASLLLIGNVQAENLHIGGFSFPAVDGNFTNSSWETMLGKCQLLLKNNRLDAFISLASAAIPLAPPNRIADGELLAAHVLFCNGNGKEAYARVSSIASQLATLPSAERNADPLIANGWLKEFLIRIATYPVINKPVKGEPYKAKMPNAVQIVTGDEVKYCLDLRWAVNLCDTYRNLDRKGFSEIKKALGDVFARKQVFSLGYRNHGRVELTQARATGQAIISLGAWAKPAIPRGLARQMHLYWGLDSFTYCLSRYVSISDTIYTITKHVEFGEGKVVQVKAYGTEGIDRGYRAYVESGGRIEVSLEEMLGWMGVNVNAWHASVPKGKPKEEEPTAEEDIEKVGETPEKTTIPILPTDMQ